MFPRKHTVTTQSMYEALEINGRFKYRFETTTRRLYVYVSYSCSPIKVKTKALPMSVA